MKWGKAALSLLDIKNLNVQFDLGDRIVNAVDAVSLSVEQGEIVGLVGESGSGKSTLVRAVMGLLPPEAKVAYDCLELQGGVRNAAMVFQDPLTYLNPGLKVGWQIKETIRRHERRAGSKEREGLESRGGHVGRPLCGLDERAADLLEMAGIRRAGDVLCKYPSELSGGQRQRIVLAIALACRPGLLIADEPTTALDATVQRQILTRLKRAAREMEMAVLLVSHDFGVIASMAERVMVMHEGNIVESGFVRQIYDAPRDACTKRLMENARALSSAAKGGLAEYGGLVEGGEHTERGVHEENREHADFLRVEHLSKTGEGKKSRKRIWTRTAGETMAETRVDDVSFTVGRGECFGLAGESGCGKTTLARMLCGLARPTGGGIYYQGEALMPIGKGRGRDQIREIQMVFQDPYASLNPCHTVGTTLEEPLLLGGEISRAARMKRVGEMLERVGLSAEDARKYPAAFSGGQRQRIALARALLAGPRLLILDEPVSALDMTTQRQILELLKQLQEERGLACLFISHDLRAVRKMSRRLGVMYAGGIVESGNTKAVYDEPWHPYTKMLLRSVLSLNPRKARKEEGASWFGAGRAEAAPAGCPFAGRCGYVMGCCRKKKPQVRRFGDREVACFLYSEEHMGKGNARAQI